jgi:hypothetical protein
VCPGPVLPGADRRPTLGAVLFGGPDLLLFLVLALGGALLVGNVLALVRPPERPREGELTRAPMARSVGMAVLGGVAAIWALATLLAR